jgi:hypothetical protein
LLSCQSFFDEEIHEVDVLHFDGVDAVLVIGKISGGEYCRFLIEDLLEDILGNVLCWQLKEHSDEVPISLILLLDEGNLSGCGCGGNCLLRSSAGA